jgi:hypothetical protein
LFQGIAHCDMSDSKENILEGREEKQARRSLNFVMFRVPRGWKGFEKSLQAACGLAGLSHSRCLLLFFVTALST